MRTAYPLVLALNAATSDGQAREAVYRMIESYIVRRAICGLTPNNYNTIFLRLYPLAPLAPEWRSASAPSAPVLSLIFQLLGPDD
jgi:hypothetical protein